MAPKVIPYSRIVAEFAQIKQLLQQGHELYIKEGREIVGILRAFDGFGRAPGEQLTNNSPTIRQENKPKPSRSTEDYDWERGAMKGDWRK
jgi:hypothetical protein